MWKLGRGMLHSWRVTPFLCMSQFLWGEYMAFMFDLQKKYCLIGWGSGKGTHREKLEWGSGGLSVWSRGGGAGDIRILWRGKCCIPQRWLMPSLHISFFGKLSFFFSFCHGTPKACAWRAQRPIQEAPRRLIVYFCFLVHIALFRCIRRCLRTVTE